MFTQRLFAKIKEESEHKEPSHCNRGIEIGETDGVNSSKFNKDKWGFTTNEQSKGSVFGKLLRGDISVRAILARLT